MNPRQRRGPNPQRSACGAGQGHSALDLSRAWHNQFVTAPIRPEDVLPDGDDNATFGDMSARKGTVAAFVANAKVLSTLATGTPEHATVLAQLRTLAPGLRAVGVLDVFAPRSTEITELFAEEDES